mgnify:FL=1
MILSNIINSKGVEQKIDDYCNNMVNTTESIKDRTKWSFIRRSERLDFLCVRCGIKVNVFISEYKDVLVNYNYLLPLTLTISNENLDLIGIISKYTRDIILDPYGGVYIDLKPCYTDTLMQLKRTLENYWITHPLCSNRINKYRRIVVGILDTDLYVK